MERGSRRARRKRDRAREEGQGRRQCRGQPDTNGDVLLLADEGAEMKKLTCLMPAIALARCGGQANTGSTGTGGTPPLVVPTVASGPLTSLGPLGVAGVQLTDTATQVQLNTASARTSSDLRLGMFADA